MALLDLEACVLGRVIFFILWILMVFLSVSLLCMVCVESFAFSVRRVGGWYCPCVIGLESLKRCMCGVKV